MAKTQYAPASMYRDKLGMGVWEHRGNVAVVGIGMSPTTRRWDETAETSVAAWTLLAARNALEDAGVSGDQVDGVVTCPVGLGDRWAPRPIPEDFANMFKLSEGNPDDGIYGVSADFLIANMPELTNVNFTMHGAVCMSNALCVAAEAVGSGLTETCLVVRGSGNLAGRYHRMPEYTASGNAQWMGPFGPTGGAEVAWSFDEYCRKYGTNHDRMAPFVVNQKRNGLMNPDGFFAQNRAEALTVEDYLAARWINKPMNLYDNDMPVQVCVAYLFTTPERAKDMKQKPVYILNHATNRVPYRSTTYTLDEIEPAQDVLAQKVYEGSGLTPGDVDVFNPYDGFTLFTQWYLEGFQWHGVKRGEAHDFYAGDISVEGPHPFSSSGGNSGSGRTRWWMHTDSIQQLQGRAGERQVRIKNGRPETAISGGPMPMGPTGGDWTVWSTSRD